MKNMIETKAHGGDSWFVKSCYQQGILLIGDDDEEEEEEAVWFHRGGDSLIYPRKAQRNWRRTRKAELNLQRKSDSTRMRNFMSDVTENH